MVGPTAPEPVWGIPRGRLLSHMPSSWGSRGELRPPQGDRSRAVAEARRIVADHELAEMLAALRAEVDRLDREDEDRVLHLASKIVSMRSAGRLGDG